MEFPDFSMNSIGSPSSSDDLSDIFRSDSITIDDDDDRELNTFNPDDFLNESFLNEFKTESERKNSESSSNCSFDNAGGGGGSAQMMQLTPPISPNPQPIIIDYQNIRVIPIAAVQSNHQQQLFTNHQHQQQRKIQPIIPKPSLSSSDSETTTSQTYALSHEASSLKTNVPVDKALIKQARLIRNRESALLSRRKKKEYMQNLEVEVNGLRQENIMLKQENCQLRAKLKGYTSITCRCASTLSSKIPTKNTGLLLALVLMVGFNLIPLGTFFTATNSIRKASIAKPNVEFHSRHLLFVNETSAETNTTATSDETSEQVPLYFNQTDRIRKANIENIRRWIPQPDLFNVSSLYDFNFADGEEKLAKMREKSRDQTKKHAKMKKKIPKKKAAAAEVEAETIPVQLYDSNFFKLHEFFEEINRKDDTFYLFSFRADHLLLPAIENPHNFSQIIKMNLIMPRNNNDSLTSSEKITMMQIETIILNTSLIQITEKSIPGEFKSYSNSTQAPIMCNDSIPGVRSGFEASKEQQRPLKRAKFAPFFPSFDLPLSASPINSRK